MHSLELLLLSGNKLLSLVVLHSLFSSIRGNQRLNLKQFLCPCTEHDKNENFAGIPRQLDYLW